MSPLDLEVGKPYVFLFPKWDRDTKTRSEIEITGVLTSTPKIDSLYVTLRTKKNTFKVPCEDVLREADPV